MNFKDPVHGSRKIEEPVLLELVESEPVQRLKRISQSGPQPFFTDKTRVTRFEHSLGVMFLLQDFDAPLEEQIAGLLHDVPHTAFSHVADFLFDTDDHEYHERFMEEIVYSSDIPDILEGHGLDVEYILDESNFGLLERDLPDLCGDRIDYFLRDWKVVGGGDIRGMRNALTVQNGIFALDDAEVAEEYALNYIEADDSWWANAHEVAMFEVFSDALERAIEIGILSEKDLFGTDEEVLETLRAADDSLIQEKLALLSNGFEIVTGSDNPDIVSSTKARFVDPLVVEDGGTVRTSALSEKVAERIEEHRKRVGSGYRIKILE